MASKKRPSKRILHVYHIRRLALLFRRILGVHNRHVFDLLEVAGQLARIFPRLKIKVVPDFLLPNAEAQAYPKLWLIKIRQGIFDGLLRGDAGARWTFAHELGHIVLQHPRRPFRARDAALTQFEQEAHTFAAEFLAPLHLAKKFRSADQLKHAFQISASAAQRRIEELRLEEIRETLFIQGNSGVGQNCRLNDQVATVCAAILTGIAEAQTISETAAEPLRNNLLGSAVLTATASSLLLDAYESTGRKPAAYAYRAGAALAAAILFIRPIREIGSTEACPQDMLALNQRCALRAATALMGITIDGIDGILLNPPDHPALQSFMSTYLNELVSASKNPTTNTALILNNLPSYGLYNIGNDIGWGDVHQIEHLMNVLMGLATARDDAAQDGSS